MNKQVQYTLVIIGIFFLGVGSAYSQKDSAVSRQKQKEKSAKEVQKSKSEKEEDAEKNMNTGREKSEEAKARSKEMREEVKQNRANGMQNAIQNVRDEYRPNEKYLYKYSGISRKEIESIENPEHRKIARNIYILERMQENEGRFQELKTQYRRAESDLDSKLKAGDIDKDEYKKRKLSLDKALEHLKNAQERIRESKEMIQK
jgi:hypothetical protein